MACSKARFLRLAGIVSGLLCATFSVSLSHLATQSAGELVKSEPEPHVRCSCVSLADLGNFAFGSFESYRDHFFAGGL